MNSINDLNNLYKAYLASKKNSTWKPEVQRFEQNWAIELLTLQEELENRTYKTTKGIEFTLNERGKTRHIVGSRMRDRVVRHSFCDNVLSPYIENKIIYDNGASQKGKGISFTRNRLLKHLRNYYYHHGNVGYILLMDFSKYYDNIRHDIVREQFNGLDEYSKWLLNEILKTFEVDVSYMNDEEYSQCLDVKYDSLASPASDEGLKFMKKSVNIGDQVSQVIGVFYPTPIDNYIKIVKGQKYYGRYMDDSYIIADNPQILRDILNGVRDVAKSLGIFINEKKTHIFRIDKGFRFLQNFYKVTPTGRVIVKINKKRVTAMRRRMKKLARLGRLDNNLFKSWMNCYCKVVSRRQRANLIKLFNELKGGITNEGNS